MQYLPKNQDEIIFSGSRRKKTNWYVITGGPSSGKTTTVNMLAKMGYKTTIENARHYIETQQHNGKTIDDIRNHQKEFQLAVLKMQIELENQLPPDEIVFLDRAVPDALAYYRFLKLHPDNKLNSALKTVSYKKVFILKFLPLVNDYVRTEDVTAQKKIHDLLVEVYTALPFPIIHIPVLSQIERVNFILKNL